MILQENGIKRKASVAVLISEKNRFQDKKMVTRGKDEHFIIINEKHMKKTYS